MTRDAHGRTNTSFSSSRKLNTELRKQDRLPKLEELLQLRQDESTMMVFADVFLPSVVGKNKWNRLVTRVPLKSMVTVTDEAFALLVLENIWDEWSAIPVNEWMNSKICGTRRQGMVGKGGRAGKYTKNWRKASKFHGWSDEGLQRMNELVELVKADREKHGRFDQTYMEKKEAQQRQHEDSQKVNSSGMKAVASVTIVVDELD